MFVELWVKDQKRKDQFNRFNIQGSFRFLFITV